MVKSKKVETYVAILYCDNCGAEMRLCPEVLTSYPPQYKYICPKCGRAETSTVLYYSPEYKSI